MILVHIVCPLLSSLRILTLEFVFNQSVFKPENFVTGIDVWWNCKELEIAESTLDSFFAVLLKKVIL